MILRLIKLLLFKKSDDEYIIRYSDVNKMMFVPPQLQINNSYNQINAFYKNDKVILVYNNGKEFFRKCIEIWHKIIELIRLMTMMNYLFWQMYKKVQPLLLKIIIDMGIIKL